MQVLSSNRAAAFCYPRQLGFGTLAYTRDKAADPSAPPSPAPSTAASGSGAGSGARPRGTAASPAPARSGHDLADTGSSDVIGWTAAAGVSAVAGGLLFLRRRDRIRRGAR
ncbi:LPXTG cell wall anchor domain-containing protein [Streptomyces sp. NPDC046942]|uniref:LPXTG cell wall anchor domain-containing protein n=1 Tax=Streptomyces sp. NPDC046942 TaxID=3155137 RepID=UPI0033E438A0